MSTVETETRNEEDVFKSAECIRRHPANPLLKPSDVPYPSELTFNAGVTKFNGQYVMTFRNDVMTERDGIPWLKDSCTGLAFSKDGINWNVAPKPCFRWQTDEVLWAYDTRLTVVEGRCYMSFAIDTYHGTCISLATTEDFERFEVLSTSAPDNRNMALFPEKVGGMFVRLERPFANCRGGRGGEGERFDMWISFSPDGKFWGNTQMLLGADHVPWVNRKIGPAAPPIRTEKGWLTLFHGVDQDRRRKWGWKGHWDHRYSVGLLLLDLENPAKIIGMSDGPIMVPESQYPYEMEGFRPGVIFPGGMILEPGGEVKMYYGASDTYECLATSDVSELLRLCKPVR